MERSKSVDFVVTTDLPLVAFCEQLGRALELTRFYYDEENVWEWGQASFTTHDIKVNVSRAHEDGRPVLDDPIHIIVEGVDALSDVLIEEVGQTLADVAKALAHRCDRSYLGGEEWKIDLLQAWEPAPLDRGN